MAYSGWPVRYRRPTAPASVHLVALGLYIGALSTLVLAAAVASVAMRQRFVPVDRVPGRVREGLNGGGVVIAVALAVLALAWLVIARRLQRGASWARGVVVTFSLLVLVLGGYAAWRSHGPRPLAVGVVPLLYLVLLSTRAARSWFRWGTY